MSPLVKNVVMFSVLIIAVIAAGFFFMKGDPESKVNDDQSSITHWVCTKCGTDYPWTAAELIERQNDPEKAKRDEVAGMYVFYCPECKEFSIVRGQWCDGAGRWLPLLDLQGNRMECPGERSGE